MRIKWPIALLLGFVSTILFNPASAGALNGSASEGDSVLKTSRVEVIKFRSKHFEIAGNLYLPIGNKPKRNPLVIWVSGSGPSYRTVKTDQSRKLINCFLESGIAYFRIDKPGCGDSKGEVSDDSLFYQLSGIVADAIKVLTKRPAIDPDKIGLFGSSQAGYIMPLVATKAKNLAFIMGSSCPGENSIEQWNYLIEKQMLCEGIGEERARINVEMFSTLRTTTDHQEFINALDYFEKNPMIIKSVNYDSGFAANARSWWPRKIDVGDESHFNPIKIIEKTTIPVFVVFGENDTQIDPRQGYEAYSRALKKAGNQFYKVEMLLGVDHNMSITKTGCLGEIENLNKAGLYQYSARYFEIIRNWVNLILKQWKSKK